MVSVIKVAANLVKMFGILIVKIVGDGNGS